MFEPSGSMGVSFTWCNCPPRLKTWLTFVFQEGKSWEAALERTRSHLCLTWNLFLVGAARLGSYWRTLVPLSQWPSKHLSLFPTLPALVWGPGVPGALRGTVLQGLPQKELGHHPGQVPQPSLCSMVLQTAQSWDDEHHSILPHG